jgi:hypothetical protein
MTGLEALFAERGAGNLREAIQELSDLMRVGKEILTATEWDIHPLLSELVERMPAGELAALIIKDEAANDAEFVAGDAAKYKAA